MIAPEPQIIATLEHYFGFSVGGEHELLQELDLVQLSGGSWLMREGDAGDALFLMVRGRLQVLVTDHDDPTGERQVFLGEIVPGDSVGEVSLLTGEPRSASIQAIRDSALIRIGRSAFESLAERHPALVMKLAGNVARMLHQSTTGKQSVGRNLRTIALQPLHDSPRVAGFCSELNARLSAEGATLILDSGQLEAAGAPVRTFADGDRLSQELKHWIDDQESRYRRIVFLCHPTDDAWSRFAHRQADIVLTVAEADQDPGRREWQQTLSAGSSSTVHRQLLVLLQPSEAEQITDTASWLDHHPVDFHLHVREGHGGDIDRVARIVEGRATGLVLAGGAARGFAHLGVYKALKELGIEIDWVGGTSIGAIMAAVVACDWEVEFALDKGREAFVAGKPFGDYTIPLVSLLRGRRMENLLEEHANYQIEDLPIPYFCVSCNLDAGSLNLHERGALPAALRASAALPGILPPAVVDQQLAIDGAVINNMPVDLMRRKPVAKVIAVDLSSQKSYQVGYDSVPSPWAVLRGRLLPFTRRHSVPPLSTLLLKATELGTLERMRQQRRQADLILNPPVRQFGMTEVKSYDRIVDTGYEHALSELKEWMRERSNEEN